MRCVGRQWSAAVAVCLGMFSLGLLVGDGLRGSACAQGKGQDALAEATRLETAFDRVLAERVEDGWVDYAGLVKDKKPLDDWLKDVAAVDWKDVRAWPKSYVLAFYINAYNGAMLREVRDRYPIEGSDPEVPANSVLQIDGVFAKPLRIAQQDVSLDQIEKDIILGDYAEHRAHFALVCAARGCPKLKNEAYHGANLAKELNLAAQIYIRGPHGARLDKEARVLYLSKIFDWYRADFFKLLGTTKTVREAFGEMATVVMYVGSHLPMDQSRFIREADFRIEFLPYDWRLNDRATR